MRESLPPFAYLEDGSPEGVQAGRVIGTYLHGALEDPAVCAGIFGCRVPAPPSREATFDRLAEWFDTYARKPEAWLPS